MANLIRKKQVDETEFSGFIVDVGNNNFYPSATNPSNYVTSSTLNTVSGDLAGDLASTGSNLNTAINQTGTNIYNYVDSTSGDISTRLNTTGNTLSTYDTNLSGYVVSVSGSLTGQIYSASGVLSNTINSTSGDLKSYTNTVSGNLSAEITASSSSSVVNSIVSGNNFVFTGNKVFGSEVSSPTINVSGAGAPTDISFVAGTNVVSVVGQNGTFMTFSETGVGSNSSSMFAVNDSAGLAYLELFDNTTLVLGRNASQAIVVSGANGTILMPNLPTSSSGLPVGAIYRDGATVKIVI